MLAGRYNFVIEQGQAWERNIQWKDAAGIVVELVGGNASFIVRPYFGHTGTPIFTLTQAAGITLANVGDNIILNMTDTATGALTFMRAVYVLEVTPTAGVKTRVLEGYIYLSKG